MIERNISQRLQGLVDQFPVVFLTGARQAGKTTLLRHLYPDWPYVSLEDPDERAFANEDPRFFLERFQQKVILDEVQRAPDLFSYIQRLVDEQPDKRFLLTGSQNFLMLENISQTLAGRTGILNLLPLSLSELFANGHHFEDFESCIFNGFFPRIYEHNLSASDFYEFYIQTYVERDVRLVRNITDLDAFIRFTTLCAGRIGHLLNLSELANDAGISVNTAKSWLSVLQASYIVYLLEPHHRNFNKRLIKMPKLYFYDTGLAASLLRIESPYQISTFHNRGGMFENLVILEILKDRFNKGKRPNLYFWRDHHGREVDLIVESGDHLIPVEIKSGKTIASDFFKALKFWNTLTGNQPSNTYLVYGGDQRQNRKHAQVFGWNHLKALIEVMEN
jgi:predicted AAA+ superfamily ATPase